jgi:hypothetical protein
MERKDSFKLLAKKPKNPKKETTTTTTKNGKV